MCSNEKAKYEVRAFWFLKIENKWKFVSQNVVSL